MEHKSASKLDERALRDRIAAATLQREDDILASLQATLPLDDRQWQTIVKNSEAMIGNLRAEKRPPLIDQFLTEYGLSTDEGVQLMRLAEALSRTTDATTANELIRDKICLLYTSPSPRD